MTASEITTLITTLVAAIGTSTAGIIMSIAALISARNSKDVVERQKERITESDKQIKILQEHNVYQDKLLMDREIELNRTKIDNARMISQMKLQDDQVQGLSRMYNLTLLEVYELRKRLANITGDQSIMGATAPLPPLPDDAK